MNPQQQQDRVTKQSIDKLQRASVELNRAEEKATRAREAFHAILLTIFKNLK